MGSDGSKRSVAPRTLSVRNFAESGAAEMENLHSIVANKLSNNFHSRRDKRRRTTAHDNQLANRRHRERRKDSQVRCRNELKQNPESGFCTSGDGTRRLRTHVWHAKWFTMTKLWGFYLPLGLQGRGRGSRALLKRYKQGVVIHDASYHFAVQLEGPEDSLTSLLDRVLVPSPSAHAMDMSHSILSGVTYGRAMVNNSMEFKLHHAGTPLSKPIAPVMYMWRHLDQHNTGKVQQDCTLNREGVPENIDGSVPFCRLWVWIHTSAFTEGSDALKCACQKEMDELGSFIRRSSLESHLTKLEVMGSGAFKLLQKILHPIKQILKRPFQLKKHSSVEAGMDEKKMKCDLLHNEDDFHSHAILSLMVKDPQEYKDEEAVNDSEMIALSKSSTTQPLDKAGGLLLLSQAHHGLWDAASGIRTPIEENVLHVERHKKCTDFLCLDNLNSGMSNYLDRSQSSRSCPTMLLRNGSAHDCLKGSIGYLYPFLIMALDVKLFYVLAYLPHFPWDYPDCNAYTSLMAIKAAASHSKAVCHPPAVRAPKVPIPPPWSTICPFDKAYTTGVDTLISSERSTSNSSSPSSLTNNHRCGFRGSVFRTNKELTCFLEDNYGGHSFLFPRKMVNDRSFLKALKDKSNVEVCPGEWEIQVPEDQVAMESPLAYWICKTGFLRGSEKPTAEAFCEVNYLAHLREEQWTEMSVEWRKKEIYVLVRNMRRYMFYEEYEVLEQQSDDLEFM
ncbi:LOW QUALITY PROTEIN: hypothetical protein EUGRSUZ_D02543 [Eucalyptus grandis]|uniref:Uncharacterized protein n=1 Tax=Eucalyptus grandis TaxID=71139 RepID=A0ACC3L8B6_EUCGR|nr:LOW QUALITY PROTEIN: hypothetical protein EUGRSUZ_D02543 [Eucalyptus grandis]